MPHTGELQFELKYCERCGGLWLRPLGGAAIYCAPCAAAIDDLPAPRAHAATAEVSPLPSAILALCALPAWADALLEVLA